MLKRKEHPTLKDTMSDCDKLKLLIDMLMCFQNKSTNVHELKKSGFDYIISVPFHFYEAKVNSEFEEEALQVINNCFLTNNYKRLVDLCQHIECDNYPLQESVNLVKSAINQIEAKKPPFHSPIHNCYRIFGQRKQIDAVLTKAFPMHILPNKLHYIGVTFCLNESLECQVPDKLCDEVEVCITHILNKASFIGLVGRVGASLVHFVYLIGDDYNAKIYKACIESIANAIEKKEPLIEGTIALESPLILTGSSAVAFKHKH